MGRQFWKNDIQDVRMDVNAARTIACATVRLGLVYVIHVD